MDFYAIEELIRKIDGVINVKVIWESESNIMEEIHIVCNELKSPKQLSRDIESVVIASLGYKIDRKIISIAQIRTGEERKPGKIEFNSISMTTYDNIAECSITVLCDGKEYSAKHQGLKTPNNIRRIVVQAVINAVHEILGQSVLFDVQDVLLTNNRNISFITVIINTLYNGREQSLVISKVVGDDINETIAKATIQVIKETI